MQFPLSIENYIHFNMYKTLSIFLSKTKTSTVFIFIFKFNHFIYIA